MKHVERGTAWVVMYSEEHDSIRVRNKTAVELD